MSLERWLSERHDDRVAAGLDRTLRPRAADSTTIDLAGNDYLGLSTDARVTAAAAQAAIEWGAGAGASRLVTGTLELHARLEAALAAFTQRPAALLFSTGYAANLGAVTALTDPDTLVVSDAHVHASLVDACRLARHGGLVVTPHNDVEAVAAALRTRTQRRAIVLVESVYSVLGDVAPLRELADLTAAHDAVLVVDEAHAIGVSGPAGRGLGALHELGRLPHVVTTMTLSKALGSQGGAVLAHPAVLDHLVNTARPFIFDTGLAPPAAAGALAAVRAIEADPRLPARVLDVAARLAGALGTGPPPAAVLSIPMGGPDEAVRAQASFAEQGIAVGCFRPPSVPDGVSRLRLTARATLDADQLAQVTDALAAVVSRR